MNKSGIYKIEFKGTKLFYIGSAVDIGSRRRRHIFDLKKGIHCNLIMQRCFNKYGADALKFSVIENVYNTSSLIIREQFFINKLIPNINICKIAGSRLGVKHTDDAKVKMKGRVVSKENRDAISNRLLGKKQSKELIKKRFKRIRANHGIRKYWFNCDSCGTLGNTSEKNKVFCSKACYYKSKEGVVPWNIGVPCSEKTKAKLRSKTGGSKSPRSKLSKEQVIKIRELRSRGERVSIIAKQHNVDRGTIYDIVNLKSYKDVK